MLQESIAPASVVLINARELVRCDWACELFLYGLKTHKRQTGRAISDIIFRGVDAGTALANHIPICAETLLYDDAILNRLDTIRKSNGDAAIISDLPPQISEAISKHLNLPLYMNGAENLPENCPTVCEQTRFTLTARIAQIATAIRVHQWPKNALVFLPVLLAQKYSDINLILASMLAYLAISFAASTIYIINDMLDIGADRNHPSKRKRPFASGVLPLRWGFTLISLTASISIYLASLLPLYFFMTMMVYLTVNIIYATYLKKRLLVDVLALAASYSLRILAGNAATGIELSFWLLAFSLFLFFSLALVKRYVEMDTIGVKTPHEKRVMGRGYRYADLEMLSQMGVASAFSAILVLALYVERAGATGLYSHPEFIWLICPIVLYVISRIWFLAKRGELKDDPVAFILRDWRSHLMGAIVASIMVAASW